MPYLNLDLDYFEHPKTRRLVGLLGKGSEVIPIKVWAYCGKYHAKDGKLTGYSAQEIESVVNWWGPEGEMVKALVKVGFLEEVGGYYNVHDWLDHSGHIEAIKERNRKAIAARWAKIKQVESETDTGVLPQEYQTDTSGIPQPTKPTKPSKKKKKNPTTPLPEDFVISERVETWAKEKGFNRLQEHLEAFKRKCKAKGYQYIDWDSAFMEAIREDWAKLRKDGSNGNSAVVRAQEQAIATLDEEIAGEYRLKEHCGPETVEAKQRFISALERVRDALKDGRLPFEEYKQRNHFDPRDLKELLRKIGKS